MAADHGKIFVGKHTWISFDLDKAKKVRLKNKTDANENGVIKLESWPFYNTIKITGLKLGAQPVYWKYGYYKEGITTHMLTFVVVDTIESNLKCAITRTSRDGTDLVVIEESKEFQFFEKSFELIENTPEYNNKGMKIRFDSLVQPSTSGQIEWEHIPNLFPEKRSETSSSYINAFTRILNMLATGVWSKKISKAELQQLITIGETVIRERTDNFREEGNAGELLTNTKNMWIENIARIRGFWKSSSTWNGSFETVNPSFATVSKP